EVEAAAESRLELQPVDHQRRLWPTIESGRTKVCIVHEPVGNEGCAPRAQLDGEATAVRVADVDRGRRRIVADKEPALRVEVVLHVAVEVEVVLVEVREHERLEADAIEAVERRAVRRRLHHATPVAYVEHLTEEALEVDRLD